MTRRVARLTVALTVGWLALARPDLQAQGTVLGTFRWQLLPYCNVLTVNLVQVGAQYHIDGTDDLCGAARKASVVGLAFPNPNGSIGFGLTTVTVPGGTPLHIDATIGLPSANGTWSDSGGNTGSFIFTPGASTGGSLRPVPAGGIALGTITGAHIAAGAITATQLAAGSVTAAQIAPGAITAGAIAAAAASFGTCPAGQYLRGIQPNGTVLCEPIGTPPTSTTADDPAPNLVGQYNSLAIGTDGLPIISHRNSTAGALRVTHCSNMACTSASSTNVDDPANQVGSHASLGIGADGLAIISHHDSTLNALRVTHCNDVACTSATSTTVDDPANNVGNYTSLAIGTDGLPVISHWDLTAGALRVTHCGNVTCTNGNTSTTVDGPTANSVGRYSSLAIGADGLPVISHQMGTANALRITHCNNVACTNATSTTVDDPANAVGFDTSLAIGTDGLVVIGHQDRTAGALRVTRCNNVACTSATSTTVDDPAYAVGFGTSLAIGTDGLAVISHVEISAKLLRVTHCSNPACTSANSATVAVRNLSAFTSLAIGTDGLPVISLWDDLAGALVVTKCASRTCQ